MGCLATDIQKLRKQKSPSFKSYVYKCKFEVLLLINLTLAPDVADCQMKRDEPHLQPQHSSLGHLLGQEDTLDPQLGLSQWVSVS